jgi:hypothetical protein
LPNPLAFARLHARQLFLEQLFLVQVRVISAAADQIFVRAALHNAAFAQDPDVQEYLGFMKKWAPNESPRDSNAIAAERARLDAEREARNKAEHEKLARFHADETAFRAAVLSINGKEKE